ncbi:MAG: hypothetical protein U1E83_01210 [Methylotetracoccus sp.]
MSFDQFETERRRLEILNLVGEKPGYTANEAVIREQLEGLGHRVSRDRLKADLAWLVEQDLLLAQTPGGVYVVTLTARGSDVARGLARVPGVAKPLPV